MDKNKVTICAMVVAVVLLLIIVVATKQHKTNLPNCVPIKYEPDLSSISVKNVFSSDKTTLANLVGYLQLLDDGTYLPVEVDKVSLSEGSNDGKIVTLTSECVTVKIFYMNDFDSEDELVYRYEGISMFVWNEADNNNNNSNEICKFDKNFTFEQPGQSRFSCQVKQIHGCSDVSSNKMFNLVLKSFELELDVNPETAKKGEFAKEQWVYSCQVW